MIKLQYEPIFIFIYTHSQTHTHREKNSRRTYVKTSTVNFSGLIELQAIFPFFLCASLHFPKFKKYATKE